MGADVGGDLFNVVGDSFSGERREVGRSVVVYTLVFVRVGIFGLVVGFGQRADFDLNVGEFLMAGCFVGVEDGGRGV